MPCVTSDGLLAFCSEFEGPEPERVRRRESLWLEARKQQADGTFAVVDDDRGTSVWTRFDYRANTGSRLRPALAGAGCGTFQLAVGGERWTEGEQGAAGQYEQVSQPFPVQCDAPAAQLEVPP